MTTPSTRQKEAFKEYLRNALLRLTSDEQAEIQTFGQMLAFVNKNPNKFVGLLGQVKKQLKVDLSYKNIASFSTDPIVEEKKAPGLPLTPNFQSADGRAALLTSVPQDVFFTWLEDLPSRGGLYVIDRRGNVYFAFGSTCSARDKPSGLADSSLVYLLNRTSGGVSISRNTIEYGAVGAYRTPEEIAAQQVRDQAAALEQQRLAAYQANTDIWRNPGTGALMYQGAAITYLGAPVRIVGDGRVFAGPAGTDQLYYGRRASHVELTIPLADVYRRVARRAVLWVVDPEQEPFHKNNCAAYSRAMVPITDFVYYADELYHRFETSGDISKLTEQALYLRLDDWGDGLGRRHMSIFPQQGGDMRAEIFGAIRAALEAGTSPGARLRTVLRRRWHVTIERNFDSGENVNFYPNGAIRYQDPVEGPVYHASIGNPTAAEAIGNYDDLLTEASLNTRLRW